MMMNTYTTFFLDQNVQAYLQKENHNGLYDSKLKIIEALFKKSYEEILFSIL